jgi:3'(2'), 5'-bisphosphate nucleotidase
MSADPSLSELAFVEQLAGAAAEIVMGYYGGDIEIGDKAGEPVTVADHASNDLIVAELAARFPDDALLSEETPVKDDSWRRAERCWIVDPLDGTSDFVKQRVGFAVMIGLTVRGRPKLGVVAVPAAGRTFVGLVGEGAEEVHDGERCSLQCSSRATAPELRVICSIAHRDAALESALEALQPKETLSVGSVGYKVGKICADEADMYVAPTARISLWDTAAPEAILHAAGGRFLNLDGQPLVYNSELLTHPRGLLATNGACAEDVVARLAGKILAF